MLVLAVACDDEAGEPAGGDTPTALATPAAAPTDAPTANSTPPAEQPTPSATPHVVVTASPDEPVASTAFIPASELPEAVMTAGDGSEFVLPIEVPPRTEYNIGLSGRLELGERGMLFWYAEPTRQSFWMRNTHYDLSIAFVDGDGTILAILALEAEALQPRRPDQMYRYAIEAPAGWFAARDLGAGDQALLDFEIPDSVRQ